MKCNKKIILLFVLFLSSTFYGNGDYPKYEGVLGEALFEAVEDGNLKEVKALIKKGADVNAIILFDEQLGTTTLMRASGYGYIEIVKVLIKEGADVNASTSYGEWSALIFASYRGHIDIVKILIKNGADVNHGYIDTDVVNAENDNDYNDTSSSGETALMMASQKGHTEIVKLLQKAGAKK